MISEVEFRCQSKMPVLPDESVKRLGDVQPRQVVHPAVA